MRKRPERFRSGLGGFGVRANSVHPRVIRSRMIDGIDVEGLNIPLDRVGEPEEVSNLVVFLSSDASS
ncbi:SDR family oxidoreductase [Leifsonia poae]|uniref:SDR family oxidoreductase n=1 Tax=Leifsonia poae TaxID=110933 RepID=UPI001CBAC745|nr:SDR family oxidoreductase [Leifsonia poae]